MTRSWVLKGGVVTDGVSPFNRGLAYGDGVFETMRVCRGRIPLLARHWQRLEQSLLRLGMALPETPLRDFLEDVCVAVDSGVLKLIVTRGEGGRGYLPAADVDPVHIVSLHPMPAYAVDYLQQGIDIGISDVRLGKNPLLAGLKHLNRLEQVLVRQSLHAQGFVEGVVLDLDGLVIEGAFSNICIISGGHLLTPVLDSAGVAGVMRACLLEQAASVGLRSGERHLRLEDVLAAGEVFLCNSINGIWPVTAIGGHRFDVGPSTRALQQVVASLY